jgi:FixJ family two-component response regulator
MGDLIQFPSADSPYKERLEKAGAHERDTREAHLLALKGRNELVHEAVDSGYLQAAVARDLKISRPSVTRILAMPPSTASDAA